MKHIKIEATNRNIIIDAINLAEGKSRVNCLSFTTLLELAATAENKLEHLEIPIKKRAGAQFYYCPEGPWAKSYGYKQGATDVVIIRKTTGWYLEIVRRVEVYPQENSRRNLIISEEQRNVAVEKLCNTFITKRKPVAVQQSHEGPVMKANMGN